MEKNSSWVMITWMMQREKVSSVTFENVSFVTIENRNIENRNDNLEGGYVFQNDAYASAIDE